MSDFDEPELTKRWDKLQYDVRLASVRRAGNPAHPRHKIGRFEGIGLRGLGGFGAVFEVYDPQLDRNVALKLVESPGPKAGQRVLEEARLLAKVSHPNVVTVLETGEYGEDLFFTMEYVNGKTAAHFCRREPYPSWQQLVEIYLLAGAGLAAAHKAGIVHGDFKPTNILLDREAKWPRVADFGLAQARIASAPEAEREEYRRRGGTLPYMAPEVLRGKAPDPRSDQFSFCVALWQSIERVLPFVGLDSQQMLDAIEREQPEFTGRWAPEALRDVLRVGLSVDPNDRYPDMDALLQAIAEVSKAEWQWQEIHDDADELDTDWLSEARTVERKPRPHVTSDANAANSERQGASDVIDVVEVVDAQVPDVAHAGGSEPEVEVVDAQGPDIHTGGSEPEVEVVDAQGPDIHTAESEPDVQVVEAPRPSTSLPARRPKGPGWGAFTAAIFFTAVLAATGGQRLATSSNVRGKGASLLELAPGLASTSACAVTRFEKGHPVSAAAEGVCTTIRLGDVGGAANMWEGGYDDRLQDAGGTPDLAFALDSLIMARTFVSQAEIFLLDGRRSEALIAAGLALGWSTDAASTLGEKHAGVWFVSFRAKLVRALAQSQHSTTPLPSIQP